MDTPYVDGQSRLNDIDVDDQVTSTCRITSGWGIVKDDLVTDGNGFMQSVYQHPARRCHEYHVVQERLRPRERNDQVWNVTDRTNLIQVVLGLAVTSQAPKTRPVIVSL